MLPPGLRAAVLRVVTTGSPGIRREPAQRLARQELARAIYRPTLWDRITDAIRRWLNSVMSHLGPRGAGGWLLIALIGVAAAIVVGVLLWIGPARRSRRRQVAGVLAGDQRSAADHRRDAERLAAAGDLAGAIVERVRAIAVELEARAILLPRPGRTASELAAEAGAARPASAAGLRDAARLFDDVRYGGRPGTLAGYQRVRDLDASIEASRGVPVAAGGGAAGTGAGPAGASPAGAGGMGLASAGPGGTGAGAARPPE